VNMGVPGIDESAAMMKAVREIQTAIDVPISIDSTNPEAIEAALKAFVGRPLINSTTGEEKNLQRILPLARKYGAAVLGLCLDEQGIPNEAGDRVAIANKILVKAKEYGLRDQDVMIDCLVKTASAEQAQVMETLLTLQKVKSELGLKTVLGVSNVSHGLPAREILNSAYLAMVLSYGLDLAIMNPFDARMMDAHKASAVLMNRDGYASTYIEHYKGYNGGKVISQTTTSPPPLTTPPPTTTAESTEDIIKDAVIKGQKGQIVSLIQEKLNIGIDPMEIVNGNLIPGIEQVGDLYDRKVYFLPQLMLSAETMKTGFDYLKPLISKEKREEKGTIILATVEGDIHDIGKNIVSIMLENYGYRIIDMGKDVAAHEIMTKAIEEDADVIGLSALMTTTMPRMKEVIDLVKAKQIRSKVIVGGAVLTQDYAEKIGADGYSADARAAVLCVRNLLNKGVGEVCSDGSH
ncbi:MAG: dihydropteroate synthase, partial [Syntrophomonadaceae bacterium]|nr:dihydropteroate synthase [Syntrophomonadaceae bacterium]